MTLVVMLLRMMGATWMLECYGVGPNKKPPGKGGVVRIGGMPGPSRRLLPSIYQVGSIGPAGIFFCLLA